MRGLMGTHSGQESGDRKRQYSDIDTYTSDKSGSYRYDRDRSRDGFGREPSPKRAPGAADFKRGQTDYRDDRWSHQSSHRDSDQYSRNDRRSDSDRNLGGYGGRDYERREVTSDSYRSGDVRGDRSRDFVTGSSDRRDTARQSYGRDAYDSRGMDKSGREWYSESGETSRDSYRMDSQVDLYRDKPTDTRRDGQDYYGSQRDQYQGFSRESDQYQQYRSDYRRDSSRADDFSRSSAFASRSQDIDQARGSDFKGGFSDSRSSYQDRADYSMYTRGEERSTSDYRNDRYGQSRGADARSQPSHADAPKYDSRSYDQVLPKSVDQRGTSAGRYGNLSFCNIDLSR